ncbi:hypothetical protein MJ575_15955 [Klebsiella pneumoniae]|nr:hypothetical protein MJ575_15955 [Klebsiella pneumoniae]
MSAVRLWIARRRGAGQRVIGLPLGILRGMFCAAAAPANGISCFDRYERRPVSAPPRMLALQARAICGTADRLAAERDLLFSRSGIVLVMTLYIFRWSALPSPAACWQAGPGWRWSPASMAPLQHLLAAALPMLSPALWRRGCCLAFTLAIESLAYRRRWAAGREVVMLTGRY